MKKAVLKFLEEGGFIPAATAFLLAIFIFGFFAYRFGYYADYGTPIPIYAKTSAKLAMFVFVVGFILMIITGRYNYLQKKTPKGFTIAGLLILLVGVCILFPCVAFINSSF